MKIVEILKEDQEGKKPRRSLNDVEIVRKGNRYVLKKREIKD